jgi:mRNA-degrading endonuclease RelE of RelBE toxin-antitoxin system
MKLHKQAERELKKLLKKEKKTLLKLVTMPMPTVWKY